MKTSHVQTKMIMRDELLLERKFGKCRPFKIPEGYFERLEADVINNIGCVPMPQKRSMRRFLRPIAWAACVSAVVIVGIFYISKSEISGSHMADAAFSYITPSSSTDDILEEMSDYVMFDNEDYYSFIADE